MADDNLTLYEMVRLQGLAMKQLREMYTNMQEDLQSVKKHNNDLRADRYTLAHLEMIHRHEIKDLTKRYDMLITGLKKAGIMNEEGTLIIIPQHHTHWWCKS